MAQFNLLKDITKRRVLLNSDFGTGKTLLLVAKAKGLLKGKKADDKKDIFIVSFRDKGSSRKSLLTLSLQLQFEHLKKAEVMQLKASGNRLWLSG